MHILWIKTELLHPVDKGGKIRTYNMLKELKRLHRITYLTLDDEAAGELERNAAVEYCDRLVCVPHKPHEKFSGAFYFELASNFLSPLPYAVAKYRSTKLQTELKRLVESEKIDLVVCDFLAPAANMLFNLGCPTLLFQHNVEAMIWKRHYQVQKNWMKKLYLLPQWLKMRSFEKRMCRNFNAVVAVSGEDRDQMQLDYGVDAVFEIPTGVDTTYFRPAEKVKGDPLNLVFTGSMDWLPNEDAISYFTDQVLPLIKQTIPQVSLTIVGRKPSAKLTGLSNADPSIAVTGRVDDVRPYIDRAAVYIVPLRIGGGTRLKIYEAMAMEKPIVSTTIGAEGLPVTDGRELMLADTPESMAATIVTLLRDRSLAKSIGERAAATVRENFGWERVAHRFAAICEKTRVQRHLQGTHITRGAAIETI
jgi:sugar transferase (PEP-CTERM/EpsH1 system associated)